MLPGDLIRGTPGPLKIGSKELQQVVAQSSVGEFISLAQYIKKNQPALADAFESKLAAAIGVPAESIPRIDQLSEAQVKEVIKQRLMKQPSDIELGIVEVGNLSREALIEEVEKDSPIGRRIVEQEITHISFLEDMADAGKLEFGEKEPKLRFPDFDF